MGKQIPTLDIKYRSIPFTGAQLDFFIGKENERIKMKKLLKSHKAIIRILLHEVGVLSAFHDGDFRLNKGVYHSLNLEGIDMDNLDEFQIEEALELQIKKSE